jgi:hypothetical protein
MSLKVAELVLFLGLRGLAVAKLRRPKLAPIDFLMVMI